jgi:hypothetical protein
MFYYPWSKLLTDAANGDLFVCHIVQEAKPLFDPDDQLTALRAAFHLRTTYTREIEHASDLGWYLARFGRNIDSRVLVRRMIWCVRTILIARSAEAGVPIFAPQALASSAPRSEAARLLLAERHQRKADAKIRHSFRQFLVEESHSRLWHQKWSMTEFSDHFVATSNEVALQTLEHRRNSEDSIYA